MSSLEISVQNVNRHKKPVTIFRLNYASAPRDTITVECPTAAVSNLASALAILSHALESPGSGLAQDTVHAEQ